MKHHLFSFPVPLPGGSGVYQEHMQSGKSESIKGKPRSRLAAQQLENSGSMPVLVGLSCYDWEKGFILAYQRLRILAPYNGIISHRRTRKGKDVGWDH